MSDLVVANKYRLLTRRNGKYDKDGTKDLVQEEKVVMRSFVEDRNKHDNNEFYVIDEEKTAELLKVREQNLIDNAKKREKEKLGQSDLVDAMTKMADAVSKQSNGDEKEDLRAQLDEMGVAYDKRAGVKKLRELIEQNQ